MRLKVFHAPNIGAAMAMVRDELGPDALILDNRAVEGGIELTAAHEPPPAAPAPTPAPSRLALAPLRLEPPQPPSPDIARAGTLRWHGVPAELATRLHRGDLPALLASQLRFGELPLGADHPPLLLVGPPGAGKTLTVARLATRLKLAGRQSLVITADSRRAGAAEQLAAFTRLLGLTLIAADTAKHLARALTRRASGEPVLVDMPGLDPFRPQDQDYLRECQSTLGAAAALVLPAGLDPAEAHDLGAAFRALGAEYLVATRLDQSRRLGGVLAAASAGLQCTEAGISPAVADGFVRLTPQLLADRLATARQPALAPPIAAQALLARPRADTSRPQP